MARFFLNSFRAFPSGFLPWQGRRYRRQLFWGPRLRNWVKAIAERTGTRKAKVALARKLAVTLHAMWRTDTPFRLTVMA